MTATLAPKKSRTGTLVLYGLFAIFYFWLAAQIPYSHDDWDWGLPIGLQHLLTADINSRYAGNFFEVIMTRSELAKILIMGACFFLLPYLCSLLVQKLTESSKDSRPLYFLIANFLLLTMGTAMWRQTYGWIAGFANFGISSVFMLLCLMQLIPLFREDSQQKPSVLQAILFFLTGMIGQLFLENLALFMVIITITANVIHFVKYKRLHLTYAAMAAGTLIGLVIMFSSAIYGTILNTGIAIDGVRSLSFSFSDSFGKILYNLFYQFMCLAQRGGQFRCAVIVILTLLSIAAVQTNCKGKKFFLALNGALILYSLVSRFLPDKGALWILLGGCMGVAIYGGIALEIILLFREQKALRCKLLTLLGCSIGLILPFMAIGENGPRIFFPSYIFLVLLILVLTTALPVLHTSRSKKHFFRGTLVAAVVVALGMGWCYLHIGQCNRQRLQLIDQAVAAQQDTVTLPTYPYEELLWMADAGEGRMGYFKEFYGIPEDMEVIFK